MFGVRPSRFPPLTQMPGLVLACALVLFLSGGGNALAETTTFAVIGDYGVDNDASRRVATMVDLWDPRFILTVGDNTYGDQNVNVDEWERRIGQYYGRFILGRSDHRYANQTSDVQRFFPAVGNHDVIDPLPGGAAPPGPPYFTGSPGAIRPGYLDYFHDDPVNPGGRLPPGHHEPTASYYNFRWGAAHFFALDSESAFVDPQSAEQQATWLQSQLATSDAAWKFVYFHHPPYSSGSHGDQAFIQWPFAAWGASAVFTGHDHTYERIRRDGIPYFVNGLGGQGVYQFGTVTEGSVIRYNEFHGAMRVAVDEQTAVFEFFAAVPNEDGSIAPTMIDRYVLSAVVPEPSPLVGWVAAVGLLGARRLFRRRSAS